jgi:hypothetical protein
VALVIFWRSHTIPKFAKGAEGKIKSNRVGRVKSFESIGQLKGGLGVIGRSF